MLQSVALLCNCHLRMLLLLSCRLHSVPLPSRQVVLGIFEGLVTVGPGLRPQKLLEKLSVLYTKSHKVASHVSAWSVYVKAFVA